MGQSKPRKKMDVRKFEPGVEKYLTDHGHSKITDKVFEELSLDLSYEKKVTKNYISYQVETALNY